jgi:hypothetical protein
MSRHTVILRVTVDYEGEARHFNANDVAALAKEGIESHYEVTDIAVETEDTAPTTTTRARSMQ